MPRAPVGLILCGGRSQRMGRDKGVLFAGAVATAMAPVTGEIWLSLRDGQTPPVPGLATVRDAGEGPLGGLVAGLEAAAGRPLLAVACDMPAVTTALLNDLVGALAGGADAAVPVLDDIPQVTCAAWSAAAAGPAREEWQQGARAPRAVLFRLRWAAVDGRPHRRALRSYDDRGDLADWEGVIGGNDE